MSLSKPLDKYNQFVPEWSKGNALSFVVEKPISAAGFDENFMPRFEQVVSRYGSARLLVYFKRYAGWEEAAIAKDMEATGRLGKFVDRMAIVNPPEKMVMLYTLKKPAIKGEIRIFAEEDLQKAIDWVNEDGHAGVSVTPPSSAKKSAQDKGAPPSKAVLMPESDELTTCVHFTGLVTAHDFEELAMKPVRESIRKHGYYNLAMYFTDHRGWEEDAAAMSFGAFNNCGPYARRVAYINPPPGKVLHVKLFGPTLQGELRLFDEADLKKALNWVKTGKES